MGVMEKMWDGISRVIRMDNKVELLAETVKEQQSKIEDLTARIIRLETALEISLVGKNFSSKRKLKEDN